MNLKIELSSEQQKLLQEVGFEIENREYSKEEIKQCECNIANHIVSQSAKNITKETIKYNEIMNILVRNEK